jgi:hypothetical protein
MAVMGECSRTSPWFGILDWSRCRGAEVHYVIQMQSAKRISTPSLPQTIADLAPLLAFARSGG